MELAKDESGQGIESSHLMNRVSGLLGERPAGTPGSTYKKKRT